MAARPVEVVDGREDRIVRLIAPELMPFAGCDVGDPEAERVSAAEQRARETRNALRRRRNVRVVGLAAASLSALASLLRGRSWRIADAADAGLSLLAEGKSGAAEEGDAARVGRPRRARVAIDTRREIRDLVRDRVIDGDV